jgi:hypothetical protein
VRLTNHGEIDGNTNRMKTVEITKPPVMTIASGRSISRQA